MVRNSTSLTLLETVEAIVELCMFSFFTYLVECALHTILCVRHVYPSGVLAIVLIPDVFLRRKKYETPIYQSRHPGLNEYIGELAHALAHELHSVRDLWPDSYQSSVSNIIVAIHYENETNAEHALERYVFALNLLLGDTDKRNRDLMLVSHVCCSR